MWQYFEDLQLLKSVKAFIPQELILSLDGAPPTTTNTASAKKRKKVVEEDLLHQKQFRNNFSDTFEKLATTQDSLAQSQQKLAESQESLAVTKRSDNIVRAADCLAETEILYEEAVANNDVTRQRIYKKKISIVKLQIEKMGGLIPEE